MSSSEGQKEGVGSAGGRGLSTPSPLGKGGARRRSTPTSSGGKKKQEEVVPTDQLDDVCLRFSAAAAASPLSASVPPPYRLLLGSLDCRRLAVKAGDWLVVTASSPVMEDSQATTTAAPPGQSRKRGRVVLRAWPGSSNAPSGTAVGASPLLLGQFPATQDAASECLVSIRPLSCARRIVAAAQLVCREILLPDEEGERMRTKGTAAAALWKARLKDVLVGQLVFPGLRLTFVSFGTRATFEIVQVEASSGRQALGKDHPETGSEPDPSLPELAKLSLNDDDDDDETLFLAERATQVMVRGNEEEEALEKGQADSWSAVGGLEAAVREVRDGVEQALESPQVFAQHGLRPTRGFLLVGPSGTGKTTLLRAAAHYFQRSRGYHVMMLGGTELVGGLVGQTERNLRQTFGEAASRAPTVMILDEVEVLCPRRDTASSDADKRMVATFLALMDGFKGLERVVVLAATSRPQAIDPAVRRPGRLDREIDIGVPGEAARRDILGVLLEKAGGCAEALAEDIKVVASRAHGFVGSDLLLVCKEAAMLAVKRRQAQGDTSAPVHLTGDDLLGGLARVRPSALREVAVEVPRVRWEDIGGMAAVKRALRECVEWPLTRPEAFVHMGIAPPKGVLLYGPPGCSKTLMARALATESGMNFLAVKGPELLSKWLGESEKALQALFKKARAAAPTVVFFDEVDALAGRRGAGDDSKASERVLSQLLTELDGVQPLRRVVVVAATNRPDLLDPALLRPGRIDRKVYVPPPDVVSRREILGIALRGVPVADDVNLDEVARSTEGFSGAEMVALCREAALGAVEEDPEHARVVAGRHLAQALAGWQRQITPQMVNFYRRYGERGRT